MITYRIDAKTKRVEIPFHTFYNQCDADADIWRFDSDAEEFGLDPWKSVEWDIGATAGVWWCGQKSLPMTAMVWIKVGDLP
tara:strand:- start:4301 stop:4543 length:243 start_codon:yes stop_codon:yes gene_type:complete